MTLPVGPAPGKFCKIRRLNVYRKYSTTLIQLLKQHTVLRVAIGGLCGLEEEKLKGTIFIIFSDSSETMPFIDKYLALTIFFS